MSSHSTDGREWARLSKVKEGDLLEMDNDFTCGIANETLAARLKGGDGGLYVYCNHGQHYLEPNLSEDGDHIIGVWAAQQKKAS